MISDPTFASLHRLMFPPRTYAIQAFGVPFTLPATVDGLVFGGCLLLAAGAVVALSNSQS